MGILNITPDSFSDGGRFVQVEAATDRVWAMAKQGASIIDIGGESTRPGAPSISEEEELDRVIPPLKQFMAHFPNLIYSIDTTKYEVARQALKLGTHIINDVSGLVKEPRFAELAAEYDAGYVLMHSQGTPEAMQENPVYRDVVKEVGLFFKEKIAILESAGVKNIILDPGIGFGKTVEHNLKLLANLDKFTKFGYPLLVGASRKSMLGKILDDREVDRRLAGTIAAHYGSLMRGANILRVHDIEEASDSIRIYNAIESQRETDEV